MMPPPSLHPSSPFVLYLFKHLCCISPISRCDSSCACGGWNTELQGVS